MDDRYLRTPTDYTEVNWNSLATPPRATRAEIGKSNGVRIGTMLFIVGALAAHGVLGYFGYRWIRSQSAQPVPANTVETAIPVRPRRNLTPAVPKPLAAKDQMVGKLHWTRKDGMSIQADPKENWKCAGGYIYSTTTSASGSTVIELVQENNQPLRCKG